MIERFQLLRSVGQFDSVNPRPQLTLARMALIYGENGRGKTTLAAILRSLGSGDLNLITERKRLGAPHDPHIVIEANGQPYVFQNGNWSSTAPDFPIFDDEFVAQNICSGIEIDASHRQNLHELIFGAQGMVLNDTLPDRPRAHACGIAAFAALRRPPSRIRALRAPGAANFAYFRAGESAPLLRTFANIHAP